WLLGVAPCVLLERWRPAVRGNQARRASLRLDLLYPVGKFLLLPVTAAWVGVITTVYHRTFPFLDTGLLDGQPLAVQMIGAFLIGDLAFYVSHRLRHSVQWFWYFHVIHHSQENLNPMTTYRTHFFDGAIETLIRTFPMALVGGRPVAWTLFIALNNSWSYFLHANVRTNLGPLRYILASPQFHRVHHSVEPRHFDRNFGEHIVVWDWLFGTMVKDFACYPPTGVAGIE